MATIKPCSNAPLTRTCDYPDCSKPAVADAKMMLRNAWAYMCMEHLEAWGSGVAGYINNITSEPLELDWVL